MFRGLGVILIVAVILIAARQQSFAEAGDPSMGIPGFVAAQPIDRSKPTYPFLASEDLSEGWVSLEYSIAPDGSVRDIAVVDAMGPPVFAQNAVRTIGAWRYKPATRNGIPVTQYYNTFSVTFLMEGSGRRAEHPEFVDKYHQARSHLKAGRADQAIAALETALRRPRSNLYEYANASYLLALAHLQKSEQEQALYHIEHALIEDLQYLGKPTRASALALAVQLRGQTGDFLGAREAFKKLKEIDPASATGQPADIVAQIDAALGKPQPLVVDAHLIKHPLFDAPGVWRHSLLRSKFSFARIVGEVKSFRLSCVGAFHEAPVDPETEWSVPTKAGPCVLRVEGAPGATFAFVEE